MIPETVVWRDGALVLLDQRKLPWEIDFFRCDSYLEVADAIRSMVVRGAPAIGVAAAYGMVLAVLKGEDLSKAKNILYQSRPTAVNLKWALDRMGEVLKKAVSFEAAFAEAVKIHREDIKINKSIGRNGEPLVPDGATVITHCNAGAIATAGWGTALGVLRSCVKEGKTITVYADETRPRLQGGRLTAWELGQEGINVVVMTDGMASWLMKKRRIDLVIVGADRIAMNGDTANKIGTYGLSIAAKAHGVPFYVAAPLSTLDVNIESGELIPIEERDEDEVRSPYGIPLFPDNVPVWNPGFDITPGENVTAIITETGVLFPPYERSLADAIRFGRRSLGED